MTRGCLTPSLVAAFWARGEAVGCAVTGFWFFENFLNVARYMADARAQVLPLVGGGEHDWTTIFSRGGVLSSDITIRRAVEISRDHLKSVAEWQ